MRPKHAFTLVELSIVLVILGLLVGGVLAGQSLIRSAELRAIITENDRLRTAMNAFRDKYFALPGDMINATSYWGAQNATPATCVTTSSAGQATCNGDGDGKINYGYSGAGPSTWEGFRALQHLANAGLIEGNYTGVGDISNTRAGVNVMRSKVSGGFWVPWYLSQSFGAWAPTISAHYWVFGSTLAGSGLWLDPILKPEDAYNIDKKVDDGLPLAGRVSNVWSYNANCSTSQAATAPFNLSYTSLACILLFQMD